MGYCTRQDVFKWFQGGRFSSPARVVSHVNLSENTLTVDGHCLELNGNVSFRADAGGALPKPLEAGKVYYAIPVSDSAFSVAEDPDGSPIDITTVGSNVLAITELPWDSWIETATSELECTMPAHIVPLKEPYPAIVVRFTAGLVAEMAMDFTGVSSDRVTERLDRVRAELKEWRRGISIRGPIEPKQAQVPLLFVNTSRNDGRVFP